MDTPNLNPAPLSEDELAEWNELVAHGAEIREKKADAKDVAAEEKRIALHGADPKSSVWRKEWRRKKGRKGEISRSLANPSVGAMRYILARHAGIPAAKAAALSGTTWRDVIREHNNNEDVRCALDALHADSRVLMVEMAHSLNEEVLSGVEVPASNQQTMRWTLERAAGGCFADPKTRSAAAGGQKSSGGGGIAVVLIADAAKAASSPLPAGGAMVLTDA